MNKLFWGILQWRERGGVGVACQTLNQEFLGSIPTGSPCCVLEQDTSPYSTG